MAASGHPLAPQVIGALQQGQLLFDANSRRVFIKDGSNADRRRDRRARERRRHEFCAGAPEQPPAPRRRGGARRPDAAVAGSRQPAGGGAGRFQIARRRNPADARCRDRQGAGFRSEARPDRARAAVVLYKPDAAEADKLEAVSTIRAARRSGGGGAALGPAGRCAARGCHAPRRRRSRRFRTTSRPGPAVQNAWYGLSLGSVLLLAAIGLAITFGVMGVINMAHGEMVMLGAYTTFVVQEVIRTRYPHLFDFSLVFAVPLAFMVAGAIGILIERTVIRFLYGRPLETLLATWGISLILQQAVRTIFGPTNREVGAPSWMSGAFEVGQITITYNRLWIICFALVTFAALLAMLRFTRLGLEMRAVTQNRAMAASMGIRTARIDALTFGLGSGIAGHRRRGAVADRQCQPQSRPGLYHR